MSHPLRDTLLRQFDVAWALAEYHLNGLTTAECLWRPAAKGLHVQDSEVGWKADWPEHEGYDLGPSSIAWLTWHMVFWWSSVIDHSFGDAKLSRHDVRWPGSAEAVVQRIRELAAEWRRQIDLLSDSDLYDAKRTRWPFADRPFSDVVSWLTVELAKNAAEVGYARFLYAART
jgi:hypothetical protein